MTPVTRSVVNLSRVLRKGLLPRTRAHSVKFSACAIDPPGRSDLAEVPQEMKGEWSMRTYERPTLMSLGLFKDVTGLGGNGPRDLLIRHQLV